MTIEVPPAEAAVASPIESTKDKAPKVEEKATTAVIEKNNEPTLSTQVKPTNETITAGEELLPSSSTEEKPKRKGLFNNPFANKAKKDSEEAVATVTDAAETSENKITKGFGNFLSKVKQTTSSNNIKELSDPAAAATPTTTTVLVEGENVVEEPEDVHENATTETTATTSDQTNNNNNNKRQSILSKLFGGNANKKKEEEATTTTATDATDAAEETDHHVEATATEQQQTETEETSSPPLSRRVTGFFAKKIPKLDKKQKSTEKGEPTTATGEDKPVTTGRPAATEVEETPVVKVTETAAPVATTNTNATA